MPAIAISSVRHLLVALAWLISALILLVALGIALGVLGLRAATRQRAQLAESERTFAAESGIQRVEDCSPAEVPSSGNRWPLYVRAAAMLRIPMNPGADQTHSLLNQLLAATGKGQRAAEARALLAANQQPLRVFEAAAERPRANLGLDYLHLAARGMPDLVAQMRLAKLEALSGRLALIEGAPARTLLSMRALGAQAAALRQEPDFLSLHCAHIVERRQLWLFRALVEEATIDEVSLVSARAQLEHDDLDVRLHRVFACEYFGVAKITAEEPSGLVRRVLAPWIANRQLDLHCALLASAQAHVRATHVPYAVLRQRLTQRGLPQTRSEFIAELMEGDWLGEIAQVQVIRGLRDLADVASGLRLFSLRNRHYDLNEFKPPRERVSGTAARVQTQPDGALIVEFTADSPWQKAGMSEFARSLAHWRLPPCR